MECDSDKSGKPRRHLLFVKVSHNTREIHSSVRLISKCPGVLTQIYEKTLETTLHFLRSWQKIMKAAH